MSDDNITELSNHAPSVESIVSRLDRHQAKIKNITVVITWSDDSCDICHDERQLRDLSYDGLVLNKYLQDLIHDREYDE